MKLSIKPVDLKSDRAELLALLQRNLTDLDHAMRFQWLYYDNPAGRARSWFVYDDEKARAIGAATVFPRLFWIDGHEERCGQVGDFAVDAAYRSLGPALRLQRATLELVDRGVLKFCYDCPPHDRGMATFQRLGLAPLCRLTRFTRLERVDDVVRRIPGGRVVQTPLKLLGNGLLWIRTRTSGRAAQIEVERHEGTFGDEFNGLERCLLIRDRKVIRSRRKAQDLNWRYRLDPLNDYDVFTARRSNELLGFAVCSETNNTMNLIDLVAISEPTRMALLNAVSGEARKRGKASVQTCIVESSPEATIARRAGYIPRGKAARIVVYPPAHDAGGEGSSANKWSLGYIDTIA